MINELGDAEGLGVGDGDQAAERPVERSDGGILDVEFLDVGSAVIVAVGHVAVHGT